MIPYREVFYKNNYLIKYFNELSRIAVRFIFNPLFKVLAKSGFGLLLKMVFVVSMTGLFPSCKKFVTIDPPQTQIVSAVVYQNDASAVAAISGIYSQMISSDGFVNGSPSSITCLGGLSADELTTFSTNPDYVAFYLNSLLSANSFVQTIWGQGYQYIFYANAMLEGLAQSKSITAKTKQQLEGEAKFIRAFCQFYLVNYFGDVPLVNTTSYEVNNTIFRSPRSEVYQQMIKDLKEAESLLLDDYSFSNGERVRPNKWAASALLARVYLYTGDWVDAEEEATAVIANSGIFGLVNNPDSVFLANSKEAIWQLKPVLPGLNTPDASTFIIETSPVNPVISPELLNAFESGDIRRVKWIDSIIVGTDTFYYPFKYKVKASSTLTEYSVMLRLAEQYLIRSEARAKQNNLTGSQSDLNAIRHRAGLPNTAAADNQSLLDAIIHERQVEFFAELGHRWLDLKRSNLADGVLGLSKSANWQPSDTLYPIPKSEIMNNGNLTQNPGY